MGCVASCDSNISELERAEARAEPDRLFPHYDHLGTYREVDVQRLGLSDTALYTGQAPAQLPRPRKGILDCSKFEHSNMKTWLKVGKEERLTTTEIGLDTVNRTGASLDLGIGVSPEFGLAPKVSASLTQKESAGLLEKQTVIEYRTHVISIKDARHPLYNSDGLMRDVAKFCKDSASAWQTDDPMYGELYVDRICVGGRLTISYTSTQGRRRLSKDAAEAANRARQELEVNKGERDGQKSEGAAGIAAGAGHAVVDAIADEVTEKSKGKISSLLGAKSTEGAGQKRGSDAAPKGGESRDEGAASRSMSVGIKVDAQSGTINFGFTNTTSDDDWEFNIECEVELDHI